MSEHKINLTWKRETEDFNVKTYSREHTIRFSGGTSVQVSAAPAYMGDPKIANPEDLMVAALSSCHMLTFIYMCAMKNLIVDQYVDDAVGKLGKNSAGKMALTEVTLHPKVTFSGTQPDHALLDELHHKAHEQCFIANSVTTEVKVEPVV